MKRFKISKIFDLNCKLHCYVGAGPSRKGRFAALFLENRPRKNLLFLLFRPLLLFFEGLFRVEIYKLEQNRADQLFYR